MAEKLSITLPAEMVKAINDQVQDGRFASVSEVLRKPCAPGCGRRKSMRNAWPRSGPALPARWTIPGQP